MTTKQVKGVIIPRHDTIENWDKATNFIPKKGEIIVIDSPDASGLPRIKIGDDYKTVSALPDFNYNKLEYLDVETLPGSNSEEDYTNKLIILKDGDTRSLYLARGTVGAWNFYPISSSGSGTGSGSSNGSNIVMYEKELTDGTSDYITIVPKSENPLSIKSTLNLTTDTFESNDTICMSVNGNEYVLGDAIDTSDIFGYIEISNKIVKFDIAGINSGYAKINESTISELQFYTSEKRTIKGSYIIEEAYSNSILFDDTSTGLEITVIGG